MVLHVVSTCSGLRRHDAAIGTVGIVAFALTTLEDFTAVWAGRGLVACLSLTTSTDDIRGGMLLARRYQRLLAIVRCLLMVITAVEASSR